MGAPNATDEDLGRLVRAFDLDEDGKLSRIELAISVNARYKSKVP